MQYSAVQCGAVHSSTHITHNLKKEGKGSHSTLYCRQHLVKKYEEKKINELSSFALTTLSCLVSLKNI